jgi:hypothetical protein
MTDHVFKTWRILSGKHGMLSKQKTKENTSSTEANRHKVYPFRTLKYTNRTENIYNTCCGLTFQLEQISKYLT